MKTALLLMALLSTLGLAACDRQPAVANPPPVVVTVPGPPGPAGEAGATGATGQQGYTGSQGETGPTGEVTNVIVIPQTTTPTN